MWPNMIQICGDRTWYVVSRLAPARHSFCSGGWADNCRWTCATLPTFATTIQHTNEHCIPTFATTIWATNKWTVYCIEGWALGMTSVLGKIELWPRGQKSPRHKMTSPPVELKTSTQHVHRRKSEKGRQFSPMFSSWKEERNWNKITPPPKTQIQTSSNRRCKDLPARIKVSHISFFSSGRVKYFFLTLSAVE